MKLHESLDEGSILIGLKSREKNELIAEVAEPLRSQEGVEDFDEFLGAVYAREMESSTGIGDGVAIPHARTDSVSRFVVTVGVAPEGVDFQAVDGKPVRLVILMGIPTSKIKAYLRLLAHMSLLLKQPSFRDQITKAQTPREVLDVLAKHEA